MFKIVTVFLVALLVVSSAAFAGCGSCGGCAGCGINQKEGNEVVVMSIFDRIAREAVVKDGVREITYEQFRELRNSEEKYALLDVLSAESYASGHIEGAESFYVGDINARTAAKRLSGDPKIVVYCGGFLCTASSKAAAKLSGLGYNVVDYKGGLQDWQERGNKLVK